MKAFKFYNFEYPDEMWKIIHYLEQRGKINIDYMKLEELYEDFSYYVYCAQWMVVTNERLEEFAEYLSEYEVSNVYD